MPPPSRRLPARRLIPTLFVLLPSLVAPKVAATDEPERAIVERFREIVVLLDGEATLDPRTRSRARMIGRVLFHDNLRASQALSATLGSAIEGALQASTIAEPAPVAEFLMRLEADPDYHDADKLALREVLDDLAATIAQAPVGPLQNKLAARVAADSKALAAIQDRYGEEMRKLLAELDQRGFVPRREAWAAYVDFVRSRYSREQLLEKYAELLPLDTDTRGADGGGESVTETFGRELPDHTVMLSFDDGPHYRHTPQLLDILAQYAVHAVFFQVGQNLGKFDAAGAPQLIARNAEISRRILASGSVLANHTYSHPLLPKLDQSGLDSEIDSTSTLLKSVSPQASALFRAPYGARNPLVMQNIKSRALRSVMWNIDSEDWADPVPESIVERVMKEVEREQRGIVLFHDIHARTLEAVPKVLDALIAKGYHFATWDGHDFVADTNAGVSETAVAARANVMPTAAPAGSGAVYRESWAVVIGIDDYQYWPRLHYAVNDASGIRDTLITQHGFKADHVFTLLNGDATRANILSVLGDKLGDPGRVLRDDRVFVFYAGHGATRRLASGRDLGYIIPVDGTLDSYQGHAISMTAFQDIAEAIPAKHVFFVMDSCYSGLGLTRGGGSGGGQDYLQEIGRRAARQMLTAGGADQQVSDGGPNGHSVFTWTLMRGLEGEGDLNGDGAITATELASYIGPVVAKISQQTPAFGSLPGSEGGEFAFQLAHDSGYLNLLASKLDNDAVAQTSELERLRAEIARRSDRNSKLAAQLDTARKTLAALDTTPSAPQTIATRSAAVEAAGVKDNVARTETAILHNERGTLLFKQDKLDEALVEFERAAAMDDHYALAANNAGYVYYRQGRYDEAVRWYERTLAIDPKRAVAWLNAGDAWAPLGRHAEARRAYQRYLELAPNGRALDYVRSQLAALPPP